MRIVSLLFTLAVLFAEVHSVSVILSYASRTVTDFGPCRTAAVFLLGPKRDEMLL